jgi:hypothetical protein
MMKRAILLLIAGTLLILGQAVFALDTDLPTMTMTPFPLPQYCQNAPVVTGTATDVTGGISEVRGMIYYVDASGQPYFWDGTSSWTAASVAGPVSFAVPVSGSLNTPGATVNWNYTFPSLANGQRYYYRFWAVDPAGNQADTIIRATICDTSNPILYDQFPATSTENYFSYGTGARINGIPWDLCIRGAAIDPSGSGQIDRVELTITRSSSGKYFNGTGWTTTPCNLTAFRSSASAFDYYYSLSYSAFAAVLGEETVTIVTRAYDKAGNYTESTQGLPVDCIQPTVPVIYTPELNTRVPVEISGEVTDSTSGVESVLLTIKYDYATLIYYWNGTDWQATPTQVKVSGLTNTDGKYIWKYSTNNLFYENTLTWGNYVITATAVDRVGKTRSATKTIHICTEEGTSMGIITPPQAFNNISMFPRIEAYVMNQEVIWGDDPNAIQIGVVRKPAATLFGYKWATKTWAVPAAPLTDYYIPVAHGADNRCILDLTTYHSTLMASLQDGESIGVAVLARLNPSSSYTEGLLFASIYDTSVPVNPTQIYSGVKWTRRPFIQLTKAVDYTPAYDPIPAGKSASGITTFDTRLTRNSTPITNEVLSASDMERFTIKLDQGTGTYSLYVKVHDLATNAPASESCLQVGYDNVAPVAAVITYPLNGSTIDIFTPTITWNPASDTLSGLAGYAVLLDNRIIASAAAGATSYTIPADQRLYNGTHTLIIRAVDITGNYADSTSTFTVHTESLPVLNITQPASGICLDTDTVTVLGLATDDSMIKKVEISLNGGTPQTLFSGSLPQVAINKTLTLTPNIANTITITVTDDTDYFSSSSVVITPDLQDPEPFGLTYPASNSWVNNSFAFTWDKGSDAVSGFKGYDLYVDSVKVNSELLQTESYTPASPLAHGTHTYYVVAWDNVGNSYQAPTFTFMVDSVAPSVPTILSPLEGQTFTSAFNVAWQPSLDPDSGLAKYEVYWNDALYKETTSTSFWMTTVPTDGAYSLKVIAYDIIGNKSTSPIVNVAINVNAPAIALYVNDKALANNAQINTLPKIRAEIQDASGLDQSSIQIYIDDQLQSNLNLQTVSSNASLVTAYNVTKNDVRLAAGTHKIKIMAKDIHGKSTSREFIGLNVAGKADITGFVMNYPNPFKPSTTTGTTINYTLADDASLKIMIYDLSGRLINKLDCLEGTEGGRFGENNVPWDGKTFIGDNLANGAYVYLIVDSKNNVIGSGEMAVYE